MAEKKGEFQTNLTALYSELYMESVNPAHCEIMRQPRSASIYVLV